MDNRGDEIVDKESPDAIFETIDRIKHLYMQREKVRAERAKADAELERIDQEIRQNATAPGLSSFTDLFRSVDAGGAGPTIRPYNGHAGSNQAFRRWMAEHAGQQVTTKAIQDAMREHYGSTNVVSSLMTNYKKRELLKSVGRGVWAVSKKVSSTAP